MTGKDDGKTSQGKIIQIDEEQIKGHPDEMVRGTGEEMLNGLLDAEAEQLVGACRWQCTKIRTAWLLFNHGNDETEH